jgi:hypothetical protein
LLYSAKSAAFGCVRQWQRHSDNSGFRWCPDRGSNDAVSGRIKWGLDE